MPVLEETLKRYFRFVNEFTEHETPARDIIEGDSDGKLLW
jgi:hypothetical protein